jgi:16S rRNA (uracil1498-N3)-methyltransferase
MNRFYIDPSLSRESVFDLSERESHHALHVLRLKANDRAVVLDGKGSELLCTVDKVGRHSVTLKVYQRNSIPALPYQLTLVQALPKGKTMEIIVQKAAELGASRVIPILAERTVAHLDEENTETKLEKWNWIAIDAIKQCGSAWLPKIEAPLKPNEYLGTGERSELNLLATLQPDAKHPRHYFADFITEKKRKPKSLSVWVGPEGDFTPAEINAIRGAGALPISLGPLVLRSETAAFYCMSVLNYELQSPA